MEDIKTALEEKRRFLAERATRIRTAGIPALQQLVLVGHTDTGGEREARALLAALYAPQAHSYSLDGLRAFDSELTEAALAVMALDSLAEMSIDQWVPNAAVIREWSVELMDQRGLTQQSPSPF